jgi:hypothetical protein
MSEALGPVILPPGLKSDTVIYQLSDLGAFTQYLQTSFLICSMKIIIKPKLKVWGEVPPGRM